ncbi:MAG: hypothetical protein QM523_01170 [Candidatus Pacebacteria bacterium]|nr:hypothetical protein [Candidatus Paceibacterota bacterium]
MSPLEMKVQASVLDAINAENARRVEVGGERIPFNVCPLVKDAIARAFSAHGTEDVK